MELLAVESSVTSRYQTTIPQEIRTALGLEKNDKLHYGLNERGEVVLSRVAQHTDPSIGAFLSLIAQDLEAGQSVGSLSLLDPAGLDLTAGMEIDLDSELLDDED